MTLANRPMARTLWERIWETLSEEMNAGMYPPGTKLPTEAELSRRFDVNRHTVRRALEALQNEGRIHVRRGAGSFVTQGRFDYPVGAHTSLSRNFAEQGFRASRSILRCESLAATRRQAEALEIAEGAPVLLAETVSKADDVPIVYAHIAFPLDRLPGFAEVFLEEEGAISRSLARVGVAEYRRRWTRLIADRPGTLIARHLVMNETHPVLRAEGLNETAEGVPIQHLLNWFCSDRVQLVFEGATSATERRNH
jgi:GntR family phosphonate transport system transcriptional regulator